MVLSKAWMVTLTIGVIAVALFAGATYAMDVFLIENVLMLTGLYVLLAPRIHEYSTEKLSARDRSAPQ